MKSSPGFSPRPARIVRLLVLAGVAVAAAGHTNAGEKIIFSGRFEKRGLPDLIDRERLLPGAVNLFPQANAPGPDIAMPQSSTGGSSALTRRQQETLEQRRNWLEHGQKRQGDPDTGNPNALEKPGDRDRDARHNSGNPFDRTEPKSEAKRSPNQFSPRDPGAGRNGFTPAGTTREKAGRTDGRPGSANNDPFARTKNPGARPPGETAADGRSGVDLPTARIAPRLGLGADNPMQQKLDRDSQFRTLLDPKAGDGPRANDFFSLSPDQSRLQQQQNLGRAFEDILRRPEPIRPLESLRPKSALAGNPLNADGPKSGSLNDFSRIMAPAPAPERPRPSVKPTEFPMRAF